jgi:hypothetical protein
MSTITERTDYHFNYQAAEVNRLLVALYSEVDQLRNSQVQLPSTESALTIARIAAELATRTARANVLHEIAVTG